MSKQGNRGQQEAGNVSDRIFSGKKKWMRNRRKTIRALTLTELLVIMSVMVILLAISIPTAKKLSESLENSAGTRSIISAAMSNARAIAVREQKYAGVRFQQDSAGRQYLVFIIHESDSSKMGGLANGFYAVPGRKPMALPGNVGLIATGTYSDTSTGTPGVIALDNDQGMTNATTFSIVFNQSGKFVIFPVQVRNKDGKPYTENPPSTDKIFNTKAQVDLGAAMFTQDEDDYLIYGLTKENSVSGFRIYDKRELAKAQAVRPTPKPWTAVPTGLSNLDTEFVNPYTGELVKKN